MRRLCVYAGTILFIAVFAAAVQAGDYADLKFIGFSADGRYIAFEESGTWDGSGGDYSTTYYVDVEKNAYAAKPSVYEWEMDTMKEAAKRGLLAKYNHSVAANLSKFHIIRGNTGKLLLAHLLTDWSFVKPVESESYWMKDGKETKRKMPDYQGAFFEHGGETEKVIFNPWLYVNNVNTDSFYELTLKKTLTKAEPCTADDAFLIEMTLQDNTQHTDIPLQTLQKDTSIPAARHCPFGYRIESVYFYKDRLAVFLNVFSQGFEGPDMRYMSVTGKLTYKSTPAG